MALCADYTAYYTAPIKALVSEKFFDLVEIFGRDQVGMITGDVADSCRVKDEQTEDRVDRYVDHSSQGRVKVAGELGKEVRAYDECDDQKGREKQIDGFSFVRFLQNDYLRFQ
jgi:hypothetical protein